MDPHRRWQAWPAATEHKAVMWREAEVCMTHMAPLPLFLWGLGVFV